jgi:hypothetical protein
MDLHWLFPYLLFLHVLGAIVAFGPTFSFRFIGAMGGAEPQHVNFATRVTHTLTSRVVLPVGITLPITGVAMILALGLDLTSRAYWWLDLAILVYVVVYTYGYFVQARAVGRVVEMTSAPPPPGASGPPPELMALVKRVQQGGMGMGIGLIAIVFLMVVKPTV